MGDTKQNDELDPGKLENLLESESESIATEEESSAFEAAVAGEEFAPATPDSHDETKTQDEKEKSDEEKSAETEQNKQETEQNKQETKEKSDQTQENSDDLNGFMQKIEARVRNMEGKFGTVNAQLQEARKTAQSQGASVPSSEQLKEAKNSSEKMNELREDFPEWADALTEQLKLNKEELAGDFVSREDFQQSTQDIYARAKQELREELRVDMKHPGWDTTVQSAEFQGWLQTQDENTRALAGSTRSADAIKLLDEYKAFTENQRPANNEQQHEQKRKNQERLEASVSPTQGATATTPRAMTEEEAFAAAAKNVHNG